MCSTTGAFSMRQGGIMSTAGRCVFGSLLRCSSRPSQFKLTIWRPCAARSLGLSSQLCASPRRRTAGSSDGEEKLSQPIKLSTSKASPRTWKVERSMGSRFQRPWWQVLPLSVFAAGFLLWCVFRQESEIDRALEKQLFEHLPGLLTNIEEEELKKGPDDGSK